MASSQAMRQCFEAHADRKESATHITGATGFESNMGSPAERPGVAMTTCGLRASSRACCCMSRPPTMTQSCRLRDDFGTGCVSADAESRCLQIAVTFVDKQAPRGARYLERYARALDARNWSANWKASSLRGILMPRVSNAQLCSSRQRHSCPDAKLIVNAGIAAFHAVCTLSA